MEDAGFARAVSPEDQVQPPDGQGLPIAERLQVVKSEGLGQDKKDEGDRKKKSQK